MSDTPDVHWDEDIPPERPEPGGGEAEGDDQPLGAPAELDRDDAPLPGLPETDPPSGG